MLKRISLVTFSTLLLCSAASAEWLLVGGTHKYDEYLDMATIGPTGRTVTFWTLKDFKVDRQLPHATYRSVRIKKQIDCLARKSRPLQTTYYVPHKWGRGAPCSLGRARENGPGSRSAATARWS